MRNPTALLFVTTLFVLPTTANAIDRSEMADLIDRAVSSREINTVSDNGEIQISVSDEKDGRFYTFFVSNGADAQRARVTIIPFENRGNPGAVTEVFDDNADGSVDSGQDPGIRRLDGEAGEEWRGFFQATYDKAWEILKSTLASPPK